MSIIGTVIKQGLNLRQKAQKTISTPATPYQQQKRELKKLLTKAQDTEFGRAYGFDKVLRAMSRNRDPHAFYQQYRRSVPVFTYNDMFKQWWHRTLAGEADVTWPGAIKHFALSSGTSEAASKHIPISKDMTAAIQKTSMRNIYTLPDFDLPTQVFSTGVLMLGGSTRLNNHGSYFDGDLSGIQASKLPMWFQNFYKPGRKIAAMPDWSAKLDEITRKATTWDIGFVAGVPAWMQMLFEKIIAYYKVNTIHDIWPNLSVYAHGGVSFEPYRASFEKLLGRPIIYMETYLASEGFLAYQVRQGRDMKLVMDNGLFFEFVPFNDDNFTADGDMVANPTTLMIDEVEADKEYAILLSTCAGAWRYLLGDVIRFTDVAATEIRITGRTKHYISLCGEHLSVENMNNAVMRLDADLALGIKEFALQGINIGSMFGHQWFVGTENVNAADAEKVKQLLDKYLKELNDDYLTEREKGALIDIQVKLLPNAAFYDFMKWQGKEGGQNKFPRVLKGKQKDAWQKFLAQQ